MSGLSCLHLITFEEFNGYEVGNFSLHHRVQTGSGPHPASYPMDNRGSFPGGKASGV
jgi:hypothetical protein